MIFEIQTFIGKLDRWIVIFSQLEKAKGWPTLTWRYIGCSLNKMSRRVQTLYYHVGTDVGDKPDPPSTLDKYTKETTFVANMPLVLMVITEVCPIGSEIMTVLFVRE